MTLFLGQPIGFDAATPPLGASTPNFPTNADHTATLAEYYASFLYITSGVSLSAGRALIMPLIKGMVWLAFNATTGGNPITVGGATGTVVTVPPNRLVRCACVDGTNFITDGAATNGLELIAGAARTTSGTFDGTKSEHPQDSTSGGYTLTIPVAGSIGEKHLVPDWGGAIESNPITVTTGTSVKVQHPLSGDRSASSFNFGLSGGIGFRNGSAFEIQWNGTLWVCLR